MDQNRYLPVFSYTLSHYLITCVLMAVKQDVNKIESLLVVLDVELAMNLTL
jgi:hypothetical protein